MQDCVRYLGAPHEDVHRWLDQYMPKLGGAHRRELHHKEGIEEAARRFGESGRQAAIVHVLRDCRNIPRKEDYIDGTADQLGGRKDWPVAAYALYTEKAFGDLVNFHLNGPQAILLWGFIEAREELGRLWNGLVKVEGPGHSPNEAAWQTAVAARKALSPIKPAAISEFEVFSAEDNTTIRKICEEQPAFQDSLMSLMSAGVKTGFCWVSPRYLISPLATIDYGHMEELRAELEGQDRADLVRFAFRGGAPLRFRAAVQGNTVVVTTRSHNATLGLPRIVQNEDGSAHVRLDITAFAEFSHVILAHERLFIANGIHRCFLLASMGFDKVPCLLTQMAGAPMVTSVYPVFTAQVMHADRPPTVTDFFDEALVTKVNPILKQKVMNVTVTEFPVPIL